MGGGLLSVIDIEYVTHYGEYENIFILSWRMRVELIGLGLLIMGIDS